MSDFLKRLASGESRQPLAFRRSEATVEAGEAARQGGEDLGIGAVEGDGVEKIPSGTLRRRSSE